jgi:hypothetical protein
MLDLATSRDIARWELQSTGDWAHVGFGDTGALQDYQEILIARHQRALSA